MNEYIDSVKKQFLYYKMLADKAMEQVEEEQLFWKYNEESNSIAIIVTHMAGNMLSRFTEFYTADGEKEWRNRDEEFLHRLISRQKLMAYWEAGWDCLMKIINGLTEKQLSHTVYIRNDGHTVVEAINRQLAHYPYHIGQIVFIAKMLSDHKWKTLSIARDKSQQYNDRKFLQDKDRRHFTDDL